MRHLKSGKRLGRSPTHRKAMFRNMATALFRHERIITTLAKAKAIRPFVEKIITLAKRGDLHARRMVIARLGTPGMAKVEPGEGGKKDKNADKRTIIQKLFDDIGPRFAERPGGYTRIIKRHERRLGDGGITAYLELLKEGEEKVKTRESAPAPAPAVDEEESEEEEEYEEEEEIKNEEREGGDEAQDPEQKKE